MMSAELSTSRRRAIGVVFPFSGQYSAFSIFLALALVGCEKQGTPAPPLPPAPSGHGTIQGVVSLSGDAPVMAAIDNRNCHPGTAPITEESIVSDGRGHLRNVIVYVKDAPPGGPLPAAASLDQVNCRYEPHVVALQAGQVLHVTSSDPAMHNVHVPASDNPAVNFATPPVAAGSTQKPSKDLTFQLPETLKVRCDVHPWMLAWVRVFPHHFFAVTGQDGTFHIDNLPPGRYTLVAWQERLGELEQTVTVRDNAPSTGDFVFRRDQ